MNHFVRLLLLFTSSLVALGLLGVAFATDWWIISIESNIPTEDSLSRLSNNQRLYSTLIRVPFSRGLLRDCTAYRNIKVIISKEFDFRPKLTATQVLTLANETCSFDQFSCENGYAIRRPLTRCINIRQKCDRIVDCEDKSDEMHCTENSYANKDKLVNCTPGYTKCPDGKSCYRKTEETCNGVSNCMDNSDEQNCDAKKCGQNRHVYCPRENACSRNENSKLCDGIVDCADSSDEENCSQCSVDTSRFHCDSKCFLNDYWCDGIVHCSDLRDESDCKGYATTPNYTKRSYDNNQHCMEKHFHPFSIHLSKDSWMEFYSNSKKRLENVQLIYYLQSIVVYGVGGGLIFLLFAVISLFFFGCCRRRCICLPFCFYGIWMLLAWLFIITALLSFILLWLGDKQALDSDKALPLARMIYKENPMLKDIEFFGLSFWLACGAALATFIGLLLSYVVCCTLGSSRADDKEYEIMQMHSY